jgi:hypothetical protein
MIGLIDNSSAAASCSFRALYVPVLAGKRKR